MTPQQIKSRYRELAKAWHPDRNPDDPQATVRMQRLTWAFEVLAGGHLSALESRETVVYTKDPGVEVGGIRLGFGVPERAAADWIYAASFARRSHQVYLAGYSGKAVLLTADGEPLRVYDIGAPPRRMWPLPAGYLLEITVLGVGGLVSVSANRSSSPPLWGNVTWAIVGAFLSLAVLGAWSIGPSVVPTLLALVAAAMLAGVRRRQKVWTQVGWFAGGVMGQAVIMLLAIFLLNRVHYTLQSQIHGGAKHVLLPSRVL